MPSREISRIAGILRTETTGGVLMLAATGLALLWANSPWSGGYHQLSALRLGPGTLRLTLASWAAGDSSTGGGRCRPGRSPPSWPPPCCGLGDRRRG